jgi:hypothetical protein
MTESANFFRASSTEGASELQVPQPGAQNHNTTGFCASAFDNTNVSPFTVFATKSSAFEPGKASVLCGVAVVATPASEEEESVPQAESAKTATTNAVVLLKFICSA